MGHRPHNASQKDAKIKLKKEECAKSMGHRSNYAARKDAQIKLKEKECA